jgi:ribonuclease J
MNQRRKIGYGGLIAVTLPVHGSGALAADPLIRPFGVPIEADLEDFVADAADAARKSYGDGSADPERMRETVRIAVRRCATLWTGKKPVVDVALLTVN